MHKQKISSVAFTLLIFWSSGIRVDAFFNYNKFHLDFRPDLQVNCPQVSSQILPNLKLDTLMKFHRKYLEQKSKYIFQILCMII